MSTQQAKFKTREVCLFLEGQQRHYASQCFAQDFCTEDISTSKVATWFQSYFPSNVNQYMYRLLEMHTNFDKK